MKPHKERSRAQTRAMQQWALRKRKAEQLYSFLGNHSKEDGSIVLSKKDADFVRMMIMSIN